MKTERLSEQAANRAAYEQYIAELGTDDSAFRAKFREAFFHALQQQLTARQYEVLWMSEVEDFPARRSPTGWASANRPCRAT